HNDSGRFESRWTTVEILESPAIMFKEMAGSVLGAWIAHGEGKLDFPDLSILKDVKEKNLATIAYVDDKGARTEKYPFNPNGSVEGITGLCSEDGRHLAMMPHPERSFLKWQWPWMPDELNKEWEVSPWLKMFQNAREWCDLN
ncbi:MAG: phosphoribosylformylglycinamidine synthase subunit PurQ, partial [Patescibacteria group bacterium]|nr:phosphoribosylformylglycinamidine synthase subunit PurQ [Patescibacteria group bacterium]